MEFKEAMRTWARMCAAQDDDKGCDGCPMHDLCSGGLRVYPDEAETILTEWQAEHPEKTIMDDFFEKHPRATRDEDGLPPICAREIGYLSKCPSDLNRVTCNDCWRRPLEEVEG